MKNNVLQADRIIRIIIGVALIALFAMDIVTGTMSTVALIAGIVLLLTGIVGFCPIYAMLGIGKKTATKR